MHKVIEEPGYLRIGLHLLFYLCVGKPTQVGSRELCDPLRKPSVVPVDIEGDARSDDPAYSGLERTGSKCQPAAVRDPKNRYIIESAMIEYRGDNSFPPVIEPDGVVRSGSVHLRMIVGQPVDRVHWMHAREAPYNDAAARDVSQAR